MSCIRTGFAVIAVLATFLSARAQDVPTPDSGAVKVDSIAVTPDTLIVSPDSLANVADSLSAAADSLTRGPDSLSTAADSLRRGPDSLSAAVDSLTNLPDSLLTSPDSLGRAPDSLLARSDSLAADSLVATDTTRTHWRLADRYLGSVKPDRFSAAPFPRRTPVLMPRLGNYWRHEIKMDSTGTRYIVRETVGGQDVRYPLVLSPEQYREARLARDRDEAFRNLIIQRAGRRNQGGRGLGLNIVVPGGQQSAFTTIFGKPEVDLRVNGQVNIDAGFSYQKSDQRISLTGKSGQLDPDFGQNIRLGITGSIGDKLRIDVNWDTERTFDFQNQLKLEYTGYEDDIVKKIVAGNVFLQTPSSLIQGGQRLFGIRTDWQLGGVRLTSVVSQQEGQAEDLQIDGGAQTTEFDLKPTDYDDATHFFLGFYFRNHWEDAFSDPPILQLGIDRITDVEVWKLQQTTVEQDNERQAIALVDLGEPEGFTENPLDPTQVLPNPAADRYSDEDLTTLRDGTQAIESYLNNTLGADPADYQLGKFKLLERRRDYTIDEFLGTISLASRLTENEAIAIAIRYVTRDGQVVQIGDFANESGGATGQQNDDRVVLKLLRKANQIPSDASWPLTMRNVYRIQGRGFTRDDLDLDVYFERPGQPASRSLPGVTGSNGQLTLLQITGLDRLNEEEAQIPDNQFDFQPYLIRPGDGLLIFPQLEPFATTIAKYTENEQYIFSNLYTEKQAEARRDSQHDVYRIRGSLRSSVQEVYNLGFFGIVEGSVRVTSGGASLSEGSDYVVDYSSNTVTITNPAFLAAGRDIHISYERNQFAAIQKKTLLGLRADYDFLQDIKLGATLMKLSEKPLIDKFRVGDEPLSNTIWGVDGSATFEPRWLTRAIDALPLIDTKAPSTIDLKGEFAQLLPGHPSTQAFDRTRKDLQGNGMDFKPDELRGISFIDDFEGVETGIPVQQPGAWRLSSVPDSIGPVPPGTPFGDTQKTEWRGSFSWYSLPLNTSDFFDYTKDTGNFDAVRPIHVNEVYPKKDVSAETGSSTILSTFDVFFDPRVPGPYNYGTDLDKFEVPADRMNVWGGMTQRLPEGYTDFDLNNVEYVEFIFSPFSRGPGGDAGSDAKLMLDLGSISEDIIPNEKLNTEDGLTLTNLDRAPTDPLKLTRLSSGIQDAVVNVDVDSRRTEDVGLDGWPSINKATPPYEVTEQDRFAAFVDAARTTFGDNSAIYHRINLDPSSDDYHHFRDPYFDNPDYFTSEERGLLQYRFTQFFPGSETNSFEGQREVVGNGSPLVGNSNIPDTEDLNLNATLDTDDRYYEYVIPLGKSELDRLAQPDQIDDVVITKIEGVNPNDSKLTSEWYQVRVPIRKWQRRVGGISDFNLMQSMRIWTTGHTEPITLRFASLKLVGSQWQKSDNVTNAIDVGSSIGISTINNEENPNYQIPNGAIRSQTRLVTGVQDAREQAMVLQLEDVRPGDERAVYKPFTRGLDMLKYDNLRMFVHGHGDGFDERGDLRVFIRLGLNEDNDYYEYEQPITPSDPFSTDADTVWQTNVPMGGTEIDLNSINIKLSRFNQLKIERDDSVAAGVLSTSEVFPRDPGDRFYDFAPPGTQLYVKGNPSLSGVTNIIIGIRAPDGSTKVIRTSEFWFNELRVTGYDEKAGSAAIATAQIRLADFANVSANIRRQTDGFGGLSSGLGSRETNDITSWSLTTSTNINKLMPEQWGWSIPVGFSIRSNRSTPRFSPARGDIRLSEQIAQVEENQNLSAAERQADINKILDDARTESLTKSITVPVSKRGSSSPIVRYTLDATSVNYSYSTTSSSSPSALFNNSWRWSGAVSYRIAPRTTRTFRPFFFLEPIPVIGALGGLHMSYVPQSLSASATANRSFAENQERSRLNIIQGSVAEDSLRFQEALRYPTRQTHALTHNRSFGLQYNPFTFLNLGYNSSVNQSLRALSVDTTYSVAAFDSLGYRVIDGFRLQEAIDEGLVLDPEHAVELSELRPVPFTDVFSRFFSDEVRTDRSEETFTGSLQPRFDRIRSLSWVTVQPITYSSRFQWQNGPAGADVGASVSNNASIRGGIRLAPQEFWRKFGFYTALERKQQQVDDQKRIDRSRRDQEKKARKEEERKRKEAEKKRKEAGEKSEVVPDSAAAAAAEAATPDSSKGGGFSLPLPSISPTGIVRRMILALTSSRDMSLNVSRTWSGTSGHVKGGFSLLDGLGGNGPALGYRLGMDRSVPPSTEFRYLDNPNLQITDRLQDATQWGAKTDFTITTALRLDLSWDARSDVREDVTFRMPDPGIVENTRSQSGTNHASVWAFGGSYQRYFDLQLQAYQQDAAAAEASGQTFINDANGDGRVVFANGTLVDDFRQAFSNSLGTVGANNFMPFPLPGWSITYTGLSNWPIFRFFTQSVTLRHSYSATYDSDYRTNAKAGFDQDGNPITNSLTVQTATGAKTIVHVIPELEQGSVRINERFQPLLGLDMTIKGGIQSAVTYSKSNSVSLSTGNADVNENSTSDWSFRSSFSKRGMKLPFTKGRGLQNTMRFTLTVSSSKSVERRFRLKSDLESFLSNNTDSETFLSPQLIQSTRSTIEPRISYAFSSRISADFFVKYEHLDSRGSRVPTTTNVKSGFNIRISIAN
ncbi:MAG: cell surface protein SprA [Rhodothermales bacterium]